MRRAFPIIILAILGIISAAAETPAAGKVASRAAPASEKPASEKPAEGNPAEGNPYAETPNPALVLALGDQPPRWRPDWPAEIPPDAFLLRGGRTARAVSVSVESSGSYLARWSPLGRILERPFFWAGSAYALSFARGASGLPASYRLAGAGEGPGTESVSLSFSADGTLAAAERRNPDASIVSRFHPFGSTLEELEYDQEGRAAARRSVLFSREGPRAAYFYSDGGESAPAASFDYDSGGRATRIVYGERVFEAVYGARDLPVAVRGAGGAVPGERRYQWDERGLLSRETVFGEDGATLEETAYAYEFDAYGEWTVRRALKYAHRFGIWAPERGVLVRRGIDYN